MEKEDYKCPFCDSHISKEKYEKVIKENRLLKEKISQLEEENKKHLEKIKVGEKQLAEEQKKFEAVKKKSEEDMRKEKEKIKEMKMKIKEEREKDKEKMKEKELEIKQREKRKQGEEIKKLNLKIKLLEEGRSASESGFDYEKELFGILKEEFENDEVRHTGKMGDILIEVKDRNKTIGTLLVELKRVARHSPLHIEEVKRHKIDARADVGILVTNGDFGRAKMDGFRNIDNILVIRPHSAVDFLKLLRKHLLEINGLKLSFEEREDKMAKLWKFIHSIEFETQMNSIFRDISQFKELDVKESKLLKERGKIEEHLLLAYNVIKEGVKKHNEK